MDQQSLADIRMPTNQDSAPSAGLELMGERPFHEFAPLALQPSGPTGNQTGGQLMPRPAFC
jgi:hypothetical protein